MMADHPRKVSFITGDKFHRISGTGMLLEPFYRLRGGRTHRFLIVQVWHGEDRTTHYVLEKEIVKTIIQLELRD